MTYYWGNDPRFRALPPEMQAAIIARMEADRQPGVRGTGLLEAAAMVNRASQGGYPFVRDFSRRQGRGYEVYQPLNEPGQYARLPRLASDTQTKDLAEWIRLRQAGAVPDVVGGATHFGATIPVMERLAAREPNKYRTWRSWMTPGNRVPLEGDKDRVGHWFYGPSGRHSAPYDPAAAERELTTVDKDGHIDAKIAPFQPVGLPGEGPRLPVQSPGTPTAPVARAPQMPVAPPTPAPVPPMPMMQPTMPGMPTTTAPKTDYTKDLAMALAKASQDMGKAVQAKDTSGPVPVDTRLMQQMMQEWEQRRRRPLPSFGVKGTPWA